MDRSEARLDNIEAQRSTGLSHDTDSVPEFLSNLRLSDLYNLPGEFVPMNPEIFSAMRTGDIEFVEKMKSYGTPMACLKSDRGGSILHLAAAFGHLELVKGIVSECPCLLLESNSHDHLPIHVAARAGHSAVVKALVAALTFFSTRLSEEDSERLNVFALKDINGDTALHLALKELHEKTELLMQHHRNRNQSFVPLTECWRRMRYNYNSFPDISKGLTETAACLVSANQHVSFLANKDGMSPLYLAVEAGNISLVNAMLNRLDNSVQGKTSNLASQLEGRKSLVHAALKAKNTDVLEVILSEDPSLVNQRDEEGRTCLSVGASVGFYEGIHKLLDRSTSDVFECDDDGSFPIHLAVEKGHVDIVKELLKRCPGSIELLNKQGQNILHIAAKGGKALEFLLGYMEKLNMTTHLVEEQDVDGNTPLHLATIDWRPQAAFNLSWPSWTNRKVLNMQNQGGLKPLDIAEINLQSDYIFRERLTLMVLLRVSLPKGITCIPTSGMTLRSRSENQRVRGGEKYKDQVNVLLLLAALVATMTFAAGFTIPAGFNSSSPNLDMAVLANDPNLAKFLLYDTVAMQCSVIAIVALIWAQLGDPDLAHRAFHLALPLLLVALFSMSAAFSFSVQAVIKPNSYLTNVFLATFLIVNVLMVLLLMPYAIPMVIGIPFIEEFTSMYLFLLVFLVYKDDATSDSDHTYGKSLESVRSSKGDQMEKSKVF